MKTSTQIRQEFLDFFEQRGHTIVSSASLVPMGDPTLLFTNAGMNQFKDVFLGTGNRSYKRVADTQKCLRVSGKHNDLDEVGHDTYHHTLFEMLGNWSFGDYFKKEAIRWAWELLVDQWGLEPDRMYATVHEGDPQKNLKPDTEAAELWTTETTLDPDHVLYCSTKDNFWMMGDTGPCGPCSELHYDMRSNEERAQIPGKSLVNTGNPFVIEIWNLVFIQYNAQSDGSLTLLKDKHVDTDMGFERVTAVLQKRNSTYDTDIFAPILQKTAELCPLDYVRGYDDIDTSNEKEREQIRIAMRVIADHIRTIAFATADRAAPSNTGRGYVIRRILRRAVRYGYQFLHFRTPFLHQLVEPLCNKMGAFFPELNKYRRSIERIMESEEESFLRTLASGLQLFDRVIPYVDRLRQAKKNQIKTIEQELTLDHHTLDLLEKAYRDTPQTAIIPSFVKVSQQGLLSGQVAFLLHDTYGFPLDLTQVMTREHQLGVHQADFDTQMTQQRERARSSATFKVDHSQQDSWQKITSSMEKTHFLGYTTTTTAVGCQIQATRILNNAEGHQQYQVVLDQTPFYGESGGQIGDTGQLRVGDEVLDVLDTIKEDGYFVHIVNKLPSVLDAPVEAMVHTQRRLDIAKHHTATHLLHAALREVLGPHVQQQGSLVTPDRLRFDFSHFERVLPEQIRDIEQIVNDHIQANIPKQEETDIPIEEALARGATALFGEKYGETVRMITFDPDYSMELCGGIHVQATGELGLLRLMFESSVASGVRRVEATTGKTAFTLVQREWNALGQIRQQLNIHDRIVEDEVARLLEQNKQLEKELAQLRQQGLMARLTTMLQQAQEIGPLRLVTGRLDGIDSGTLRDLAQSLSEIIPAHTVAVLGSSVPEEGKAYLAAVVSNDLIKTHGIKAGDIVNVLAKMIGGGGGGRPNLATAGGKEPQKLDDALAHARHWLQNTISA